MPTFAVGLTPEEKKLYSQLFKALDPDASGSVTGAKARATFEKSGLPPNILGEIWQLSDVENTGSLLQFGFCNAMRLIGYTQAGAYPTAGLADKPGPLPLFGDMALSAQPTAALLLHSQPSLALHAPPHDPVLAVSAPDYHRFAQMYVKTTGLPTTPLDGAAARDIFLKAKLPTDTLGRIWSLVDVANRGALDLPAFVMAMHLIHGVLSGALLQLPPFLPDHVWLLVRPEAPRLASASSVLLHQTVRHVPLVRAPERVPLAVDERVPLAADERVPLVVDDRMLRLLLPAVPRAADWCASPTQILQMDSIFDSLDRAHAGLLSADQVAAFLMTSRLDQADLATIWDLADIQNTGVFGRVEFGIALFLVNRRRAGLPLPNVVPDSLLVSLRSRPLQPAPLQPAPLQLALQLALQPAPLQLAPLQPPAASQSAPVAAAPKSSIDELADIFGSPEPPKLAPAASSSDLYPSDLPKVRKQLTSSFKPTSSFGQTLLANTDSPSLIGDDVPPLVSAKPQSPVQTQAPAHSQQPLAKSLAVDYEALRAVPPPPKARELSSTSSSGPFPEVRQSSAHSQSFNNDLLADSNSDVSAKLSEATSEIANISNQVKSLTGQTSNLHEKKIRAEQELARILATKQDIEGKLKQLRTSYANEVAQVGQVEANLASAREESEALRSEASITEAKLNQISTELNEKQMAVEELQKSNSALKEKLGYMNAEISELEKEFEAKSTANTTWVNDQNIKRSQLQVVLVKVDDLKQGIAELDASNYKLQQEVDQALKDEASFISQTKELQARKESLLAQQKELLSRKQEAEEQKKAAAEQKRQAEEQNSAIESHLMLSEQSKAVADEDDVSSKLAFQAGIGHAVSAVAGSVIGGAAVLAGSRVSSGSQEELAGENSEIRNEENSLEARAQVDSNTSGSTREIPGAFKETEDTSELADLPEASVSTSAVGHIQVDQFVEKPSGDMTGLGEGAEDKEAKPPGQEFDSDDLDGLKSRFPEVDYDHTDQTVSSSGVADSYRHTEGETPITSPDNSEYRYPAGNSGVVGGMVGMPGVLVGVQRTDSLTSSVQNNASMSVRDDNIDTVSDRETLGSQIANGDNNINMESNQNEYSEGEGEGERHSSGVGLFELVSADDAKLSDGNLNLTDSTFLQEDLAHANEARVKTTEEEFPPIKELDYDESSSSDSESTSSDDGSPQKFDDAVDSLNVDVIDPSANPPSTDFDENFDDLAPAVEEMPKATQDDFFDNDFDGLTAAQEEKEVYDADSPEVFLDDNFTGSAVLSDFVDKSSSIPDFSANSNTQDGNDEWEQLFAGFGSAGTASVAAPNENSAQESSRSLAIDELIGMGFDSDMVVAALEKENWNIEAATNYLLDSA